MGPKKQLEESETETGFMKKIDEQWFGVFLFSRSDVSDSLATPWPVTHQAPLSMGFPGEEYWSGLPFRSSRASFLLRDWTHFCIAGWFFTTEPPGKPDSFL